MKKDVKLYIEARTDNSKQFELYKLFFSVYYNSYYDTMDGDRFIYMYA